jgi:hypothetical protein
MQKSIKNFIEEYKYCVRPGFLNAMLPWFSPTDLSKKFGKTRQYWCKIIKQGKLCSKQTSCGPIVTTEYLLTYFEEDEKN